MVSSSFILCCYLFFIAIIINEGTSLKLTDFLVPDHAEVGSSVTLTCHFDAGTRTLNSVKWYKGEHEFFRYIPSTPDILNDFPADGVHVDLKSSGKNKVTLRNLTFNSSGHYKCEVSTDMPDFELAYDSKNMTVVSFPEWGPVITDVSPEYSVGQMVTANCSVAPSYPSPTLAWEINGRPVEDWYGYITETEIAGPGQLSSRRSALQFVAEEHFFHGTNQAIILRCRAKLGSVTSSTLETSFTSQLAHSPDSLESAQQRFGNLGSINELSLSLVLMIISCITVTML